MNSSVYIRETLLKTILPAAAAVLLACSGSEKESSLSSSDLPVTAGPFRLEQIYDNTWAITEKTGFETTTCYLLAGNKKALLFDTGLGTGDIQAETVKLTTLPVMVLNSHSHYDHIGGNYLFAYILGPDLPVTVQNMRGLSNAAFEAFYRKAYLQDPDSTAAGFRVQPYQVTRYIHSGDRIDLGDREVEILFTPGHSGDDLCLLDEAAGVVFSGDVYYEGALFAHLDDSDLKAYRRTAQLLDSLAGRFRYVCPAHSRPMAPASRLGQVKRLFEAIDTGTAAMRMIGGRYVYASDSLRIVLKEKLPVPG